MSSNTKQKELKKAIERYVNKKLHLLKEQTNQYLLPSQINSMHSIIAAILFYNVQSSDILKTVIEIFHQTITTCHNKYQMNEVVMILRFLRKQSSELPNELIETIHMKEKYFWNAIEKVELNEMNESEKELYCIDYVNGFGFMNLLNWIEKPKTPYLKYALMTVQYMLNDRNHYDNIYNIFYIFNTPKLYRHETFVDIYERFFLVINNIGTFDYFFKIIVVSNDKYKYFSLLQQCIIKEFLNKCNSTSDLVHSMKKDHENENAKPIFGMNDLEEIKRKAQIEYERMKRKWSFEKYDKTYDKNEMKETEKEYQYKEKERKKDPKDPVSYKSDKHERYDKKESKISKESDYYSSEYSYDRSYSYDSYERRDYRDDKRDDRRSDKRIDRDDRRDDKYDKRDDRRSDRDDYRRRERSSSRHDEKRQNYQEYKEFQHSSFPSFLNNPLNRNNNYNNNYNNNSNQRNVPSNPTIPQDITSGFKEFLEQKKKKENDEMNNQNNNQNNNNLNNNNNNTNNSNINNNSTSKQSNYDPYIPPSLSTLKQSEKSKRQSKSFYEQFYNGTIPNENQNDFNRNSRKEEREMNETKITNEEKSSYNPNPYKSYNDFNIFQETKYLDQGNDQQRNSHEMKEMKEINQKEKKEKDIFSSIKSIDEKPIQMPKTSTHSMNSFKDDNTSDDEVKEFEDLSQHLFISIVLIDQKSSINLIKYAMDRGGVAKFSYESEMRKILIEFRNSFFLKEFLDYHLLKNLQYTTF